MKYTREDIKEAAIKYTKEIEENLNKQNYNFLKNAHKHILNTEVIKGEPTSIKITFELKTNNIDALLEHSCLKK